MFWKKFVVLLPAFLMAVAVLVQPSEAHAKQRLEVKYKKFAQDLQGLVWIGPGSVNGNPVQVKALWPLSGRRVTGKVTHVTKFLFGIYAANADVNADTPLFVVDLVGIINISNGKIVMNGSVSGSAIPTVPVGSKSQLRAQAATDFTFTEGSVFLTVP